MYCDVMPYYVLFLFVVDVESKQFDSEFGQLFLSSDFLLVPFSCARFGRLSTCTTVTQTLNKQGEFAVLRGGP